MARTFEYRINLPLDPADVARVFETSGIARPTKELGRIARMFSGPCLVVSAWLDHRLVGVCRSLTDYTYCCYLADLAVDKEVQGEGIGSELVRRTQIAVGERVSIVLVSAPEALSYYPKLGFSKAEGAFIIRRKV